MHISISCEPNKFTVYINGSRIGIWSYIEGALEAIRLEVSMRANDRNSPYPTNDMQRL